MPIQDKMEKIVQFIVLLIFSIYDLNMLLVIYKMEESYFAIFVLVACSIIAWIVFAIQKKYGLNGTLLIVGCLQITLFVYGICVKNIMSYCMVFFLITAVVGVFGITDYIVMSALNLLFFYVYYVVVVVEMTNIKREIEDVGPSFINCIIFLVLTFFTMKMRQRNQDIIKENIKRAIDVERYKEEFIEELSRKIKEPLSKVISASDVMIANDSDSEEGRELRTNANDINNIVDIIIDYSELKNNTIVFESQKYKISEMVDDVIETISQKKISDDVAFLVNIDSDLPKELIGDSKKIKRIMENLISASIDYTKDGYIEVSIGGRKESYGWNLKITISDTGEGINNDSWEKLSYNYNNISIESKLDTGIISVALSVCKQLIYKMGGTFICKSEMGKGTTIQIVLPQKISIEEEIINTNNLAKFESIIYIDFEKFTHMEFRDAYKNNLHCLIEQLKLKSHICINSDEFEKYIEKESFTHVITMLNTYNEKRHYFDIISEYAMVIVIIDNEEQILQNKLPINDKIVCIQKPFHLLGIYSVLLGEKDYVVKNEASYVAIEEDKEKAEKKTEEAIKSFSNAVVYKKKEAEKEATRKADNDSLIIGDLDTKSAVLFCGSEKSYLKILKKVVETSQSTIDELNGYYENKEWKNYTIKIHALKSTTLSIGAKEVSAKAKSLEMASKEQNYDFVHENHKDAMKAFEDLVKMIIDSKVLGDINVIVDSGSEDINTKNLSKEEFDSMLKLFENAAYDWNTDQMKSVVNELNKCSYYGINLAEKIMDVSQKINDSDLISANELILSIKNKIEAQGGGSNE